MYIQIIVLYTSDCALEKGSSIDQVADQKTFLILGKPCATHCHHATNKAA